MFWRQRIKFGRGGAGGAGQTTAYVGPLDLLGTAALAYGQRALSAAKVGSALFTLRRSSDNTTQTFNSDLNTGGAPIASINTFIGAGSGFVTSWADQSTGNHAVVQATAATQPLFVSSFNGGKSAIGFDNTVPQGLISAGNASVTGGSCTIFYVSSAKILPPPSFDAYCSAFAINRQLIGGSQNGDPAGGAIFGYLGGAGPSSGNSAFANSNLFNIQLQNLSIIDQTIQFSGLNTEFNDTSIPMQPPFNTGSAPCADAVGRVVMGGYASDLTDPDGFSQNWNGYLLEVIVYPGILSDSVRAPIRVNMANYYGIQLH